MYITKVMCIANMFKQAVRVDESRQATSRSLPPLAVKNSTIGQLIFSIIYRSSFLC